LARRGQLVEMLVAEKNRRHRVRHELKRSLDSHLAYLEGAIKALDSEIDDTLRGSPVWAEKGELLEAVKGVGDQTVKCLLIELPELGRLDRQAIAKLVGLAPMNRDSGMQRGHRVIQDGRTPVRNILYLAANSARQHNAPFKAMFERLRAAGKPHKVAMIAVA